VEQQFRPEALHGLGESREIEEITYDELRAFDRLECWPFVKAEDLVSAIDQSPSEVASDEAGGASHEDLRH
jgi:hypothetical protein